MSEVKMCDLQLMSGEDLIKKAEGLGIKDYSINSKQELVCIITKNLIQSGNTVVLNGAIEVLENFSFIRLVQTNYSAGPNDVYVAMQTVKKFNLRTGDMIECEIKNPKDNEKYFAIQKIISINDHNPETRSKYRINFDNLTAIYPVQKIKLEIEEKKDKTMRVIEIVSPIGFGQRSLIVAPPRAGKTCLLEGIAHAVAKNHPAAYLIVLLIGERPEEVTDMLSSVNGEVVSSTFDEPPQRHIQIAEIVLAKAKRLVEEKRDVVILLDSITRLARAYNSVAPTSGKVLTGGIDANALQKPKRFLGAARNTKEAGSLTVIGTTLVDTGSKQDGVIFEEFKGTGNSETVLSRTLADRRVYPAIDIAKSGTRREERLLASDQLAKIWLLRKILAPMGTIESIDFLLSKLEGTKNNEDFFCSMSKIDID